MIRQTIIAFLQIVPLLAAAAENVYESDMRAFVAHADEHYPFFDLKDFRGEWDSLKVELIERAKACETDEAFMLVVRDAVSALRDSHASIVESPVDLPPWPAEYYPGLAFLEGNDNQVIAAWPGPYEEEIPAGTVVTHIDGEDAFSYLQERGLEAWSDGGNSSPQRAALFEWRMPFRGDKGAEHTLACTVNGKSRDVVVTCNQEAGGWPHAYNMPARLQRGGRSIYHTRLASGVGYMYLRRVDDSVAPGIDAALSYVMYAKGWIVDLRGNGGGGYDQTLLDALGRIPGPVAVIIDAGTVSAGETLARDIRRICEARVFGERSAGSSSSKHTWQFPSGIASLRISARSRWRNDGEPIEYNGVMPDTVVKANPEDVSAGRNTTILAAEKWCLEQAAE